MERYPLGSTVDVLDGSLASAWSALDGNSAGSPYLPPSIPGNVLLYPTMNVAATKPEGTGFAGATYFNNWGRLSQLFTSSEDTQTFIGNNFLADFPAFKDFGGPNLNDAPKVLSLYGAGSDFNVTSGTNSNNNNSRSYTGNAATNRIPLVGMSETTTVGSFPDNTCWCRNEWTQSVDIPNSATKVKFGAYIRVPENDDFRAKNCGGVYIAQWTNLTYPTQFTINAITVKRDADSFTFLTGQQAQGLISQQNWSGLRTDFIDNSDKRRWNDTTNIESVDYESTSNHRQFRKVEKEVTLAAGTSRKMTFNMFFGENQGNIDDADPKIDSGAIQFYQPFVIFE